LRTFPSWKYPRFRTWDKPPSATPSNEIAEELIGITPGWKAGDHLSIGVRDSGLGVIAIGWQAWRLHPRELQGVGTVCGTPNFDTGGEMWRPARWQFIKPAAGGAIDYEQADAWFSYAECKAYVMQRVKTPAQPTAGGLAYAFRTRCPRCKLDDRDLLHLITPSQELSERQSAGATRDFRVWMRSIEHSVLPLHLGTAFVSARLDTSAIQRFKDGGIPLTRTSGAVLSVHISQGVRDPEPIAMVYVEDAPGI